MTGKSSKGRYSSDLETLSGEVRFEYYKSRGPGGQRKNKRQTAVRLIHPPSGVTVTATESRYQAVNKRRAFQRLQEKLRKLNEPNKRRIATSVPLGEIRRRREEKKRVSQKKRRRRGVAGEDVQ